MNMKKCLLIIYTLLFITFLSLVFSPNQAFAEDPCDSTGINFCDLENVTLKSDLAEKPPAEIINALVPYILSAAGFLLLIYLISSGFQYLTSRGDPGKTAAAKGKITNALAGLLIVFLAYWVVEIAGIILGSKISEAF